MFGDNAYFILKFRKSAKEFLTCVKIRRDALETFIKNATQPVTFDKVIKRFCGVDGQMGRWVVLQMGRLVDWQMGSVLDGECFYVADKC